MDGGLGSFSSDSDIEVENDSDGDDEPGECHFPSAASHLAAESYCFLCHRDLPEWPGLSNEDSDNYNWEFNLVGLQELPFSLRVARLAHRHSLFGNPSPRKLGVDDAELCFLPRCPGRDRDRPVHIAHEDCWSVARRAHGSLRSLSCLAATTRHVIPLRYSTRPDSPISPPDHDYGETALGELLAAMARRLPTEICSIILGQAGGARNTGPLVSSLVHACSAAPSSSRRERGSKLPAWQKVAREGLLDRLVIETDRIHGLSYITEVKLGGPDGSTWIPLRGAEVRGIRIALDTYGLRAVRVLYEDRSLSPWLGNPQCSWFGEVYGNDLEQLSVLGDARRILRVSFGPAAVEHPSPLSCGLWSQECALDNGLNRTVVNYRTRVPSSPAFYDGWSLYPYIAFGSSTECISGLTAYLRTEDRLVGYAAHGHRYQLAGSNAGMALHLPLRHDERVVAVWVSLGESYDRRTEKSKAHYLLVTTSLGRSHVFGPDGVLGPSYPDTWTCVVSPGALAAGIFFNDADAVVGATWRPDPSTPSVQPTSPGSSASVWHAHLSTASLADVRAIDAVRNEYGDKVIGLLVTHSDGVAEALGSYDPKDAHLISAVYEASADGPLLGLAMEGGWSSHLVDIVCVKAVTAASPAPNNCHGVFGTECTIAWWDSREFGDKVEVLEEWELEPVHEISPLPKMALGPDVAVEK